MSWAIGYDTNWGRDIGYGVLAFCDKPGCNAEIDRGLSFVCGAGPYGGDKGCGLYFCSKHQGGKYQQCPRCAASKSPYKRIKPDHPAWIIHKLIHESWAEWRKQNPQEVLNLQSRKPNPRRPQNERG